MIGIDDRAVGSTKITFNLRKPEHAEFAEYSYVESSWGGVIGNNSPVDFCN